MAASARLGLCVWLGLLRAVWRLVGVVACCVVMVVVVPSAGAVVMASSALAVQPAVQPPPLVLQGAIGSGGSGSGEFTSLNGVATDPSTGDVYAVDWGNERIQVFSSTGTLISMFGGDVNATTGGDVCTTASGDVRQPGTQGSGPGQFSLLVGVAISPFNGDIYVADGDNSRVEVFDSAGDYLSQFGTSGTGPGEFSFSYALAIDPSSGAIYVTDAGNQVGVQDCRVEEFSPTGGYLSQFGSCGSGPGEFGYPDGIALSPTTGDIYVTDRNNNNVQIFNSSGQYLSTFGTSGLGTLNAPCGISIDPATGDIDVGDLGDSNLITFDPSGNYISTFSNPGSTWVGVAPGPGGVVYAADNQNDVIDILAPGIPAAPTVNSEAVTNLTTTAATLNASVNAEGNDTTYYFEYVDDANYNPSAPDPYSGGTQVPLPPGTDIGSNFAFVNASVHISGLTQSTDYHYRVVAINSLGTEYGPDATFTTYPSAPSIDGESSQNVTADSATLNAQINPDLADTTYYFEYVDDADYDPSAPDPYSAGTQIPLPPGTDIGSATNDQSATENLTGLSPATLYHWRVVAINSVGTAYGTPDETFTTQTPMAPSVDAESSQNVTADSATLDAQINPDWADTTYYFEYVDDANYNPSAPDPYSAGTQVPVPPGTDIGSEDSDQSAAVNLSGLASATLYHWRVVAINAVGTTYSTQDETFTTQTPTAPSVDGQSVSNITDSSATLSAQINPDWADTTYYFEYADDADYNPSAPDPYSAGKQIPLPPGMDIGSEDTDQTGSVSIVGLAADTVYHYRVVAINSVGTTYGTPDQTFAVTSQPGATTGVATAISQTAAQLAGVVNPMGWDTAYWFEYGKTTQYGSFAPVADGDAGSGVTPQAVTSAVSGLTPNTTYHYRLVATNAAGLSSKGADRTFETLPDAPLVVTGAVSSVTGVAATLNGTVNPNGASTTYWFEYGLTTAYGTTVPDPAQSAGSASSAVSVSEVLSALQPDMTYHYRLVAVNGGGTTYGPDETLMTVPGAAAVKPPTARVGGTAMLLGRTVRLTIVCTGGAGTRCGGKVTLKARLTTTKRVNGKLHSVTLLRTIGVGHFSTSPGQRSVVNVRVTLAAAKALRSMTKPRVTVRSLENAPGSVAVTTTVRIEGHSAYRQPSARARWNPSSWGLMG